MKLSSVWTDSKNRLAIEAIMGTIWLISALAYGFGITRLWGNPPDGVTLGAFITTGLLLLGVNAKTNLDLDRLPLPVNKEGEADKGDEVKEK